MKTRGIIITGKSFLTENKTSLNFSGGISDQALRRYLVYWDEIHYVDPSLFGGIKNTDPKYKLLFDEKILKNIIINFPDKLDLFSPLGMASRELAQMDYYKNINKSNKEMLFSIAQSGNILNLPSDTSEKINTLELSIENYLPIPINCELDKILEFKEKRNTELFAFRDRINDLKISLKNENFSKEELIKLKEKIHRNLLDIHRVMDENKFQKSLSTMKTYLNLGDSKAINILRPLLGTITANSLEIPLQYGLGAGFLINAAINLGLKKQSKLSGLPKETQDFAYLYYMEKIKK
ncbi:DUF6236 family protein [Wenyingzhuangia aestuarii]|uniref:DUF6236 family protein n=1 Tax=Wenyingzhuangia aestuarii TaxID=1647582 RepID=UPI0014388227|nr:DUF6236 family protein [Wenyingzhuangia aestuarii]NJB84243.1 hypothetical protein [Wenyingzhuangia aestuarii]